MKIQWIKNHPVIRIANEVDWPPFDFNVSGEPKGLVIDHIRFLAQKVGLEKSHGSIPILEEQYPGIVITEIGSKVKIVQQLARKNDLFAYRCP